MGSHAVISPLIVFYITAFDWVSLGFPDKRLGWLLATSYFCSCVFEIGRKIRSPVDEETGVETYSALWGRRNAIIAWLSAMAVTGWLALCASQALGTHVLVGGFVLLLLGISVVSGIRFLRDAFPGRGKQFQLLTAVWTLGLYLLLGFAPAL